MDAPAPSPKRRQLSLDGDFAVPLQPVKLASGVPVVMGATTPLDLSARLRASRSSNTSTAALLSAPPGARTSISDRAMIDVSALMH